MVCLRTLAEQSSLAGAIPETFSQLTNLQYLNVEGNNLSSRILTSVGAFPHYSVSHQGPRELAILGAGTSFRVIFVSLLSHLFCLCRASDDGGNEHIAADRSIPQAPFSWRESEAWWVLHSG
jgi:hypothetical protein